MKRILLFVAMQLAVLLVVSIVGSIIMSLLGIRLSGGSYTGLLIMCAIYGWAPLFLYLCLRLCARQLTACRLSITLAPIRSGWFITL